MAPDLAVAYVSIALSTKGLGKDVATELGDAGDKAGRSAGKRAGKSFSASVGDAMKKVGKVGLIAAGAGAAGVLFGGFKAAMGQQESEKVLSGLYGDAGLAKKTLEGLAGVSKTSPIDYAGYTDAANSLAYAGVQGDDAIGILENVGLAITASGGDSSNLNRASDAVLKMVNAGKVQLDTLQQLSNSGVPILSGLASHFGKSIDDVNAMASAGAIDLQDVLDVMQDAEGETFQSMKKAGKEASGSFSNQWKIAKDNVSQAVGKVLLPLIEKLTPVIGKVADFMADKLIPAISDFFGWLKNNKATVLTFVGILGTVVTIVGLWTAAQALLNAVMTANPIGLIVVAIAGLAAGFVYLWNKSEGFRNFWIGLWESITSVVSAAFSGVKAAIDAVWSAVYDYIVTPVKTAWNWVTDKFAGIAEWVGGAIGAIATALNTAWDAVYAFIVDPVKTAWAWVVDKLAAIRDNILAPLFDGIALIAKTAWETIEDIIIKPVKAGWKWVTGKFGEVLGWIGGAVDAITAGFKTAWDFIKSYVIDPIKAGWKWVTDKFGAVLSWIGGKVDSITSAFKKAWDFIKHYLIDPAKAGWKWVTDKFGKILGWIGGKAGSITSAFKKAWDFIKSYVIDPIKAGWAWVSDKFTTVAGWIGVKADGVIKVFRAAWNLIRKWIINPVKTAWKWVSIKFGEVAGWIGGVVDKVVSAFKGAWDWIENYIIDPVTKGIKSAKGALIEFKNWMKNFAANQLSISGMGSKLDPLHGMGIPGHASGGSLAEGWNMINERGPELLHKSGSTVDVITSPRSQQMMQGGSDNSDILAQLRVLTSAVVGLGGSFDQSLSNSDRSSRLMLSTGVGGGGGLR